MKLSENKRNTLKYFTVYELIFITKKNITHKELETSSQLVNLRSTTDLLLYETQWKTTG